MNQSNSLFVHTVIYLLYKGDTPLKEGGKIKWLNGQWVSDFLCDIDTDCVRSYHLPQ